MQNYMFAYHGGRRPKTQEEGLAHREKWMHWIKSLGDIIINPGTPLQKPKLVNADGCFEDNDPEAMKGFAIIQAASMEEALAIAEQDPFIELGGTIRVSQMMAQG